MDKYTHTAKLAPIFIVWGQMINGERNTDQFWDFDEAVASMSEGDTLYVPYDYAEQLKASAVARAVSGTR